MKQTGVITFFVFVYILFQCIYFPAFFTFSDENTYLHQAWLLTKGYSQRVTDLLISYGLEERGDYFASSYPIGNPLLLYPFTFLGFRVAFLLGLVLHLSSFCIFIKILKKLRYDRIYALLYLFFPGIVFFSRTLMSELPSITAILLAFYFYLGESKHFYVLSGFFFGLACLFRYVNLLIVIPFFFISLLRFRKRFIYMVLGILPFCVFIPLYNNAIYGSFFKTGIRPPRFDLLFKLALVWKYFLTMVIIYPLLAVAPFFYVGRAKTEIILVYLLCFFAFCYSGVNTFHYDYLKNLVIGNRYFFPIIPLLLLTYIPFIKRLNLTRFLTCGLVILLAGVVFISIQQYSFNQELKRLSDVIYENTEEGSLIFCDGYVVTFLNQFRGERKVLTYEGHTIELDDQIVEAWNTSSPSISRISNYYQNYTTYLIFAEPAAIKQFRSRQELEVLRSAEQTIVNRYNYTLIYEQKEPDFMQIYKIY